MTPHDDAFAAPNATDEHNWPNCGLIRPLCELMGLRAQKQRRHPLEQCRLSTGLDRVCGGHNISTVKVGFWRIESVFLQATCFFLKI